MMVLSFPGLSPGVGGKLGCVYLQSYCSAQLFKSSYGGPCWVFLFPFSRTETTALDLSWTISDHFQREDDLI